jgi:hypothetical protein
MCRCSVQCGTFITETIFKNRNFLPQVLSWRKEILYFIKGPGLALTCFTSFYTHSKVDDCEGTHVHHKQRRIIRKPAVVQAYNDFMGGKDTSNILLCTSVNIEL